MSSGASRDTSMGFSTFDGIPMATRCGALNAGVVLYLLQQQGMNEAKIEKILYEQSGLPGISGLIADSRELSTSSRSEAREARATSGLDHFDVLLDEVRGRTPAQHIVTTEEIGRIAAMLASEVGMRLTGSTIYADAGFHVVA